MRKGERREGRKDTKARAGWGVQAGEEKIQERKVNVAVPRTSMPAFSTMRPRRGQEE